METGYTEVKVRIKLSNPPAGEPQPEQTKGDAADDIVITALEEAMANGAGTDFYVDEVVVLDNHGNWNPVFPRLG